MHPLVPQFILDNHRSANFSGSFQAAVLFVDTSGFTALAETLSTHGSHGAEVLARVIRDTFAPLFRSVYTQGGWVASQEGDAFTAVFPKPEGEIEFARRAVSAAVAIQETMAGHKHHSTPYGEFQIQVKIGMAFGNVSWTILRAEDDKRAVYYFRGEAIDRSSAAQAPAAAGESLLDGSFLSLISEQIETEPAGDFFRLIRFTGEVAPALSVPLPQIDLELAARYYPRELYRWSTSGEFRQVAILFVSLPTIRNEAQLATFMQTLFDLLDRYGGLLSQVGFGDKGPHLLLFWGAPVAYENDIERLLNFILDLQTQTAIPIIGGATYRTAHTGFIGSELAETFAPFGVGTNLAARFMSAASRGEIWLDEAIARRAAQQFQLDENGERRFKGFGSPQKVFVLVDRKEEFDLHQNAVFGRGNELQALVEFCGPVFAGRCAGALVIWGEPGMGKSHLAYELIHSLKNQADQPFQFIVGQSDEILRQPFNPFRYWLRRAFQISDAQGESRNKRNFNRKVDELIAATTRQPLADELDRTRSFLGALLDLYWADSLYEQVDAKGRYENTTLALIALLEAECSRRPVLFLLEDAHWLDEDTYAFLPRLLHALDSPEGTLPFALLITARPENSMRLAQDLAAQEISLGRLSRTALADLAKAQLGGIPQADLMDALEERTEGNPFFCEQTLQYLKEEGLLDEREGNWSVRRAGEIALPADVGSLLVARLDHLRRSVKEIVQTAAVLGREFEMETLGAMLPSLPDLNAVMKQAEAEKIWSPVSETRWSFRHILLRDAAYQMQVLTQRTALHRLALQTLQAKYAGDGEESSISLEHLGALAYHAEAAGQWDEAVHYLDLGGQSALNAYQNRQAEEYFTRALALADLSDAETRCKLLIGRETAAEIQGKPEQRQEDLTALERLGDLIGNPDLTARIRMRRANFLLQSGAYQESTKEALQALETATATGADAIAITAYQCLAVCAMRLGEYSAGIADAQKGLALAEKAGYRKDECTLWNTLGLIAIEQRDLVSARENFEHSLEIARLISSLINEAPPLNNLGLVAGLQGDYGALLDYYEQALEIARKTGNRYNEGLVLGNLGWHAGSTGEFSKAKSYGEQFLHIARETGNLNGEVYGLINLSVYAVALANYSSAHAHAASAVELARRLNDRSAEAWGLTYQGHAWLETGRAKEAEEAYTASLTIRRELDQPVLALEPLAGLALAALAQERQVESLQHVEAIMTHLDQGSLEGTEEPVRVYLACYRCLSTAQDSRARVVLENCYRFLQERAAKIQDETARGMFLENIPAHRELMRIVRSGGLSADPTNRRITQL